MYTDFRGGNKLGVYHVPGGQVVDVGPNPTT